MSRWYRAYEGTVTDAKLHEAAVVAGVSRSVSIASWHALLESAAGRNNCGSFDVTARRIAVILCEQVKDIEAVFAAFEELGLIEQGAVARWKDRQFQSDDSAPRVRKHREKKRRETAGNANGNADVTACNGDVTPPETETETYLSSSNEDVSAEPTNKPLTKAEVIEAWQSRMVPQGFPAIRKMTGQRERLLRARLRDSTLDEWLQAMAALERSAFCRGENDRGWRADFDFLLQPKSFTKLLEGAYDH
jgi:hypothetical protein